MASAPQILARSLSLYARRPLLWLLLAATPLLPGYLGLALVSSELLASLEAALVDPRMAAQLLPGAALLSAMAGLVPLGYVLGTGALATGLHDQLASGQVRPGAVYVVVLGKLRPLIGSMLLALGIVLALLVISFGALLLELGLFIEAQEAAGSAVGWGSLPPWVRHLLSVTAIIAAMGYIAHATVKWSVFAQVAVFEGGTAAGVLWRSRNLIRGRWWHAFWVLAGALLLQVALSSLLGILGIALLSGFTGGSTRSVIAQGVGLVSQVLAAPLAPLATTWLYWDLRDRKERQ